MSRRLKLFHVFSPNYETHHATYVDPPEYGCDVVEVEAASERDALLLGVQEMRRKRMGWVDDNRSDGKPPWAGIRVEQVRRPRSRREPGR